MRILTAIFFSLYIFSALAQDDRNSSAVVIKGEKNKADSSSYDSITLDEKSKQLYTLADILEERVGVQVKRYGSEGSYSTVSIRGSNANQVAVFLDGIPLGDSAFGEVNLETIPIDSIEKIEIYRGSAPVRFGASNIGGVGRRRPSAQGEDNGIRRCFESAAAGSRGGRAGPGLH